MFGISVKDYDFKLELAGCWKGCICVAQHLPSQEYVAIRIYDMENVNKDDAVLIRDETLAMRLFSHANLHTFHVAFTWNTNVYIVTPLMCFGSCRDLIDNCFKTGFPEILIALIMRDILNGLQYLHSRGYIHRSIRASHILLNQTKAVLSGFRDCTSFLSHGGRIRALHQLPPQSIKALNWLAPEVLEQNINGYTEKSDIYSIGITCCELANGIEPFANTQPTFMLTEKLRGNIPTILDRSTCPYTDGIIDLSISILKQTTNVMDKVCMTNEAQKIYVQRSFSDEFHQFIEICTNRIPNSRLSAMKLLNHSFFKQCRNDSILDVTKRFGMEKVNYEELKDNSTHFKRLMQQLHIKHVDNDTWSWEF